MKRMWCHTCRAWWEVDSWVASWVWRRDHDHFYHPRIRRGEDA